MAHRSSCTLSDMRRLAIGRTESERSSAERQATNFINQRLRFGIGHAVNLAGAEMALKGVDDGLRFAAHKSRRRQCDSRWRPALFAAARRLCLHCPRPASAHLRFSHCPATDRNRLRESGPVKRLAGVNFAARGNIAMTENILRCNIVPRRHLLQERMSAAICVSGKAAIAPSLCPSWSSSMPIEAEFISVSPCQ